MPLKQTVYIHKALQIRSQSELHEQLWLAPKRHKNFKIRTKRNTNGVSLRKDKKVLLPCLTRDRNANIYNKNFIEIDPFLANRL